MRTAPIDAQGTHRSGSQVDRRTSVRRDRDRRSDRADDRGGRESVRPETVVRDQQHGLNIPMSLGIPAVTMDAAVQADAAFADER